MEAGGHIGVHLRDQRVNALEAHLSPKACHEVQAEFLIIEVTIEPGEKCLNKTDCPVEGWPVTDADGSRMKDGS